MLHSLMPRPYSLLPYYLVTILTVATNTLIIHTAMDDDLISHLMKQRTILFNEKDRFLPHKSDSAIPRLSTSQKMKTGMEDRVITLYLDLNDDMLTPCDDEDPVDAIATARLLGETDESIANLKLLENSEIEPKATASWKVSIHSDTRVYAVLKVSVMLKHPPGISLVLRKRICFRVVEKIRMSTAVKNLLSSGHDQTGVTYEVVTGTPKFEGMLYPDFPSNHPSYIKLEENDDVVEKYKETIISVSNILINDQSAQQEFYLAEKSKIANSDQIEESQATSLSSEQSPHPNKQSKPTSSVSQTKRKGRKLPAIPRENLDKPTARHNLYTNQTFKNVNREVQKQRPSSFILSPMIKRRSDRQGVEKTIRLIKPSVSSDEISKCLTPVVLHRCLPSVQTAEKQKTIADDQRPFIIGEKVIVNDCSNGTVKFVGLTKFGAGEWIGVALENPTGVIYFKYKDKGGLVHQPGLIHQDEKNF